MDPETVDEIDGDPVLAAYLALIEREMDLHPETIRSLSPELLARAESLVAGIEVDLDEDLGDVEIP
ncbi:MAG: type II toxin-antitoxin system PrlF family antitoxin [Gemmatimonadetes bacterium]|nr:type II toxin-antitoxin system PrlF family antitoxin [Gemmatimonadota bacterium]